jgi:hypothetical protein
LGLIRILGCLFLAAVWLMYVLPLIKAGRRQQTMHRDWPVVTGFVVAHRLRQDRGYFAEHQVRFAHAGRETTSWVGSADQAAITGHQGEDRIDTLGPERAARRILDRHPVGQAIRVRVNPANHAEAFRVERELPLTLSAIVITVVMSALTLGALYLLFVIDPMLWLGRAP